MRGRHQDRPVSPPFDGRVEIRDRLRRNALSHGAPERLVDAREVLEFAERTVGDGERGEIRPVHQAFQRHEGGALVIRP